MKATTQEIGWTGIIVSLGLMAGNFIYAGFSKGNWNTALDRTIFQFVAVIVFGGCLLFNRRRTRS
jgi:hypothetical protein